MKQGKTTINGITVLDAFNGEREAVKVCDQHFPFLFSAKDKDEALALALDKYYDANLGNVEIVESDPIIVEDEDGNFLMEK